MYCFVIFTAWWGCVVVLALPCPATKQPKRYVHTISNKIIMIQKMLEVVDDFVMISTNSRGPLTDAWH